MKNNKLIYLEELNKFEMFKIPSIGIIGTLIQANIGSAKVMYHDKKITDKMGEKITRKDVAELISPNTEVIRSGKINNKLRKRFKIKDKEENISVDARETRDSL